MTVKEADKIRMDYYEKSHPDDADEALYLDALDYLIRETKLPHHMVELGGHHYENRRFELAAKYYHMALDNADRIDKQGLTYIHEGLGYIYYYGRIGEPDYEQAFVHYEAAAKLGNITCAYKVADMYKNGFFVEKNPAKNKEIIERLYKKIKNERRLYEPYPEIVTRLARIRMEEGKNEEAIDLFLSAKNFLRQRMRYSHFFGHVTTMKWLVDDLYTLTSPDPDNLDLYDLLYLLKKPIRIVFWDETDDDDHVVEAVTEDGACVICFDGKWFRTPEDFIQKAKIGECSLTEIEDELWGFEILGEE